MSVIYSDIKKVILYGLEKKLLHESDIPYAINTILNLLGLPEFEDTQISRFNCPDEPSSILNPLLDFAANKGLINPDTISRRDIFEAKIMDALLPRPSELESSFNELLLHNSKKATNMYYNLSKDSNYIKTSRTDKNVVWKSKTKYGILDMTINLSKPEKDPKDIIAAGKTTTRKYPKCLLCLENVGYNGDTTNIGRTSHRVIPMMLNNEPFNLQYSPYVYYNEHCIVFHKEHIPMNVSEKTFKRLFDFVDRFPHYFLGSNAGLPIVGGSILSHEHYQGGAHTFAIEHANILSEFTANEVSYKQLYWPLSVVRLESKNKEKIIKAATNLYEFWEGYTNEEAGIFAKTDAPHNAITPIARKENDSYILDMTLRNNRTSDDFPLGIFHPHPEHHHIKKENIGLIEVMGLAVLPARLAKELPIVQDALIHDKELDGEYIIHNEWLKELKAKYTGEDINQFMNDEVALKFMKCIENAGVFKEGSNEFANFMNDLEKEVQ